jgi:hypothetical protein
LAKGEGVVRYTYDTEFLEDGTTINLISIGIVAEDGREYYGVNSEADWDRIKKDDWMMENVVRHLPTHRGGEVAKRKAFGDTGYSWGGVNLKDVRVKPKLVIANEVREFLLHGVTKHIIVKEDGAEEGPIFNRAEKPELWAYYASYDHVALAQLYGKMISLPKGFPMWTHDLMQLIESKGVTKEMLPPQSENQHDALADARWNMAVLKMLDEI